MTPTITDPATAPTVAPVVGKRARLRNGEIVGPMAYTSEGQTYCWEARNKDNWLLTWTDSGDYDITVDTHALDIIAILDDEVTSSEIAFDLRSGWRAAEPEPQAEAEVAPITGYLIGGSTIRASNVVVIEDMDWSHVFTPAEARALLQVLPGLIKIAEGK